MATPLAEQIRPNSLDDVVGQQHLLGANKPLRRIVESGHIPNMIFYGSSGIGKTTVARIIAEKTNMRLHKLNGTSCSTADIKAVFEEIDSFMGYNGILLYLDEIQYLNKKQQQSLLEHIENGNITLIASTTENPYFYVYNAILSRSTVFEFKPVPPTEIEKAITRAFTLCVKQYSQEFEIENGVMEHISRTCGGDVRKAINATELCYLSANISVDDKREITLELAQMLSQKSSMQYDRNGDQHYNVMSALQKSVRGSDENAALHYLARLLEAGDIISACRRILVIACEDIGLAHPQVIPIVKACCDSARELGMPEARIPLANAVILLATSPKSNSAIAAIDAAMADIKNGDSGEIPSHLQDGHYEGAKKMGKATGYKYPHFYKNHYVKQQYLPDVLKDKTYYEFGENRNEQASLNYRKRIIDEND